MGCIKSLTILHKNQYTQSRQKLSTILQKKSFSKMTKIENIVFKSCSANLVDIYAKISLILYTPETQQTIMSRY